MKKLINEKSILIASVALLLLVVVGTTLAFVFTNTDPVENTFTPSKVSCAVLENGDETPHYSGSVDVAAKSDVKIKNTGDTDAYIRVAVVVTWKKADGTVWAQTPIAGTDYTNWTPGAGWKKIGDYYYYTSPVAPGETTGVLIDTIEVLDTATAPEGCFLSVEIVASAIQAKPAGTVEDQWGVDVSGDEIVGKGAQS